jgi:hypothetical protein
VVDAIKAATPLYTLPKATPSHPKKNHTPTPSQNFSIIAGLTNFNGNMEYLVHYEEDEINQNTWIKEEEIPISMAISHWVQEKVRLETPTQNAMQAEQMVTIGHILRTRKEVPNLHISYKLVNPDRDTIPNSTGKYTTSSHRNQVYVHDPTGAYIGALTDENCKDLHSRYMHNIMFQTYIGPYPKVYTINHLKKS